MNALTPGPWAWQQFGADLCLTSQTKRRPIVLAARPALSKSGRPKGEARLVTRDPASGLLVPIDADMPDMRLIAAAPSLRTLARGIVLADLTDVQIENQMFHGCLLTLRNLLAAIDCERVTLQDHAETRSRGGKGP